jgi:hypothetical protein
MEHFQLVHAFTASTADFQPAIRNRVLNRLPLMQMREEAETLLPNMVSIAEGTVGCRFPETQASKQNVRRVRRILVF